MKIDKDIIIKVRIDMIIFLSLVSLALGCFIPKYSFAQFMIVLFIFTFAIGSKFDA